MTAKAKILVISDSADRVNPATESLRAAHELVTVPSMVRGLAALSRERFEGVYVGTALLQEAFQVGKLLQNERILESMPDGLTLLDADNTIVWGNSRLKQWSGRESIVGSNFYSVLGSPEILGPDYCPFHSALLSGNPSFSTLRSQDNRYFHVHAVPLRDGDGPPRHLIVTVRDVTVETLQQQKLKAIHEAGQELADLKPDELVHMTVDERIELLKSNILHYTKDLLNFDVVEIRLLDAETGRLDPLLAVGIEPEAARRDLFAAPQDNGVTGYVASTGKSYLCEDTTQDPLYIEGAKGAKSSLTVPLILHDEVIGTFNVESPEPRAFTESDLQFLEIFTRDVAVALNTLDLLSAEKAGTAAASVEAIHSAVALPVDDILNDAVKLMERYKGHEAEMAQGLARILRNARDIKQVIQKVGQKMAPAQACPAQPAGADRDYLRGRQVLVADADESVRSAAHALLERFGCTVETAHDGEEALCMVRNMLPHQGYDVIIADIRLPDMSGYQFMCRLQECLDHVPLVLMTGFGYDPGHSIVKARQAGLKALLYKPFRLDQLLEKVDMVLEAPRTVGQT